MAHALFTIDVWDTILRRNCHPDEVKLFTARALLLVHGSKLRPEVRDATALLHARQLAEHDLGRESLARIAGGCADPFRQSHSISAG